MKKNLYTLLFFLLFAASSFSQPGSNYGFPCNDAPPPPSSIDDFYVNVFANSANGRSVQLLFSDGEFACAYRVNLKIVTRTQSGGYIEMQAPGYPVVIPHNSANHVQEYWDLQIAQLAHAYQGRVLFKYEIRSMNWNSYSTNFSSTSSSSYFPVYGRAGNTQNTNVSWFGRP